MCTVRAVRDARCSILDGRHTRDKRLFTRLLLVLCSKGLDDADVSAAERLICRVAAGPLPAHHRRTRRKYVHVGSYAASMPRKVPRRWAGKDQSRWSVVWLQAKHGVRCSDHRVFDQPFSIFSIATRAADGLSTRNLQTSHLLPQAKRQAFKRPTNSLARCPCRLRDPWRHGCRQGASTDGFTACPASGEGTAHPDQLGFGTSRCC